MHSTPADAHLIALLRRGVEQTREPSQRDADGSAVAELTHMLSSSKRTVAASGEELIPCPLDQFLVLFDDLCKFSERTGTMAIIVGHADFRPQPKFGSCRRPFQRECVLVPVAILRWNRRRT